MRQRPIKPTLSESPPPIRNTPPAQSLLAGVAELSPAYFGVVMATGIVSLAAHMLAMRGLAQVLFRFNLLAYGVLWLLTVARMVRYPGRFFGDLVDHLRGPGFFTTVAGTSILGSQFVILAADVRMGLALWFVAIALWGALTYAIFMAFTIKEHKPALEQGISGSWLLAVVATQSIAVLGALLAARMEQPYRLALNFFALSMLLWGGMLYIWMMSLIFYRYTFLRLSPSDLLPPYWINMGAMAISTLAGSLLVMNAAQAPFLQSLLPFLKGFTVFYWAAGTWWIPMLLILGVWRHIYRRFPLRYDPLYWSIVFPLGMYAAATYEMEKAMGLDLLGFIPPLFLYGALCAWGVALAGLVYDVMRRVARHVSR
jgi:tellurite resistance protein TehA-like permease